MYLKLDYLREHVLESNLIEGYHVRGGPLYQSHLQAAINVARRPTSELPLHPKQIHRTLSRSTEMESFGGEYRDCGMMVGRYTICPHQAYVPELMDQWWSLVEQSLSPTLVRSKKKLAEEAFRLHCSLLWIHPFEDGNGRTSRLFLNSFRMRYGLPWLVIEARNRGIYYAKIKRIDRILKERNPEVYVAPEADESNTIESI